MNEQMPRTPFSTPLSGSARETEIRLRNIFSGPKRRPPALFLALMFSVCIFCGNLVSCQVKDVEPDQPDIPAEWDDLAPPDLSMAQVDWDNLPELEPIYTGKGPRIEIEGLEGVHADWNRSSVYDPRSSGNTLYFGGDPAFCCPSLAGRTADGSAQWRDESGGAVSVSIIINDDRLEGGTINGYYLQFTADWGKQTVSETSFTSEVGDGVLELSEKEMLYAGWVLSRLMTEAEWTATADLSIFPAPGPEPQRRSGGYLAVRARPLGHRTVAGDLGGRPVHLSGRWGLCPYGLERGVSVYPGGGGLPPPIQPHHVHGRRHLFL